MVDGATAVEQLNKALEGQPYKLAVVDPKELELLDKNARFMRHETFRNLVDNVKRDGGLSSIPLCWKRPADGKFVVLSGNHRVMAAREAGLERILVLFIDRDLSRSEQVAIQLSHNALVGQDDPTVLSELWAEIEDVAAKYYAGLDDKEMAKLAAVSLEPLSEVRMDFRVTSFMFLPEEVERLDQLLADVLPQVPDKTPYLARIEDFDRLMKAIRQVNGAFNVKNAATALMLMLDIYERHQTDLEEGFLTPDGEPKHKSWVPLTAVLGRDEVPADVAAVLKRAVDKMVAEGDVSGEHRWRALEFLVAEYLSAA